LASPSREREKERKRLEVYERGKKGESERKRMKEDDTM